MDTQITEIVKRKGLDADVKALLLKISHLLDRNGDFECGNCDPMSICGTCEMLYCFPCMDEMHGEDENGVYTRGRQMEHNAWHALLRSRREGMRGALP